MYKFIFLAATLALSLSACSTNSDARYVTRLDATTVQSAQMSFQRMSEELPQNKKQELVMAMIAINLSGVGSAYDVVRNAELQSPSIGRIKDRVAGMTAEEIIAYAANVSTVKIEAQTR
ncbi:MAG: hypothetical protein K0M70_13600 [Arenimonas sp.]|uniref:DUF6694 family lipoprotein n=1 Tax=Arenimonas sp. TaxID=1872635 RepID=UPI0025BF362F|nr:DUF6694 family lipoprotein [Arenimonas sp.]MBW8368880.1 hypothetical protein [Arenimonas sp.]